MTKLRGAPRRLADGCPRLWDGLTSASSALFGASRTLAEDGACTVESLSWVQQLYRNAAVASAITPPVAAVACAADSISRADPMRTGVSAVKSGIVMCVIPRVFAPYSELLLIEAALIDPKARAGETVYLPWYDGALHLGALARILLRLVLALYVLSSALSAQDKHRLPGWEIALRVALSLAVLALTLAVAVPAVGLALALLGWHWGLPSRAKAPGAAPAG